MTSIEPTAPANAASAPRPRRQWTRERIEELLAKGNFGYQRVDLPFEMSTPGEDRRPTADLIFPPRLDGMSVLDLGSNHGFFCFEAMDRGAARAVGFEHRRQIVQRAQLLGEIKGSGAEFVHHDLDVTPVTEDFDYILCLNVLHHLDNPLLQLERMMAHTRRTLVLELAGFGLRDCFRALEVSPWLALLAVLVTPFPVMFIGLVPGATPDEPRRLKFYFTKRAIRRLFARESARFPRVEFRRSPFKDRFLVIAHREP